MKKYKSFKDDYAEFVEQLTLNPKMGVDLGGGLRKVRMAITSKNKGKSGGVRVITANVVVSVVDTDVYLLTVYDKSEISSIDKRELREMKENLGL